MITKHSDGTFEISVSQFSETCTRYLTRDELAEELAAAEFPMAAGPWIPVTERLPEDFSGKSDRVFVVTRSFSYSTDFYNHESKRWRDESHSDPYTHWASPRRPVKP